jgi:hypothetical protein
MPRLTPEIAKAILRGARDRAKKMYPGKQTMRLRVGTFVNVLQAEPGLISYERTIGLGDYFPTFDGWRIELTDETYEATGFRAKIVSPMGSYLEAAPRVVEAAA